MTTAPTLYGPGQFPFTNGQFVREIMQPDGKRLVAGYASGNLALARYNTDGTLDLPFGGGDGKVTVDFGTPSDTLLNASLRPDGKILLFAMTSGNSNDYQVVLARLNPDGTLDSTFADNGHLLTGVGRNPGFGIVTSVLTDGRIHVTGDALDGSGTRGYEYDANGRNAVDRLAKVTGTIEPAAFSGTPLIGPPAPGTSAYVQMMGPFQSVTSGAGLTPQDNPSVDEGSPYTLALTGSFSGGDGWNIDWGDNTNSTVLDHPQTTTHSYTDNAADPYRITATSGSIYLRSGESYTPAGSATVVNAGTLAIESDQTGPLGALDLNNNDLVVSDGDFSTIRSLVFAGRRFWPDPAAKGIISSDSQAHGGSMILAVVDNSLQGWADWPSGSSQAVGANAIIGKYTYWGDDNLDGKVTGDDYSAVDANLGQTPPPGIAILRGDTNFSGTVTGDDYSVIDGNLGKGTLATTGVLTPAVTRTGSVTVNNVAPTATIGASAAAVAPGTPMTFTAFVDDPGVFDTQSYSWTIDSMPAGGNSDTLVYTPTAIGSHTIGLTVTDKDGGTGTDSVTINVASPPNAPASLNAVAVSSSEIDLTWSDQSSDEDSFNILVSTDGTTYSYLDTAAANQTTYQATGLDASTAYWFKVEAVKQDVPSSDSNAAGDTTSAIAVPTGLAGSVVSSSEIDLSWTDTSGDASGYGIEWSTDGSTFSPLATVDAGVFSYPATNLAPGTNYTFRVRAMADNGESGYSSAYAWTKPATPSGLTATLSADGNTVNLAWNGVNGATGYAIQRQVEGDSGWTSIGTTNANVVTLGDPDTSEDTTYLYEVRALGTSHDSDFSAPLTFTHKLAAPNDLTSTRLSNGHYLLTWVNHSQAATLIRIQFLSALYGSSTWYDYSSDLPPNTISYDVGDNIGNFRIEARSSKSSSDPSNTVTTSVLNFGSTFFPFDWTWTFDSSGYPLLEIRWKPIAFTDYGAKYVLLSTDAQTYTCIHQIEFGETLISLPVPPPTEQWFFGIGDTPDYTPGVLPTRAGMTGQRFPLLTKCRQLSAHPLASRHPGSTPMMLF